MYTCYTAGDICIHVTQREIYVYMLHSGRLYVYMLHSGRYMYTCYTVGDICIHVIMLLNISVAGMKMEGLFRVPGPAAVLDELRVSFEEGTILVIPSYYIMLLPSSIFRV